MDISIKTMDETDLWNRLKYDFDPSVVQIRVHDYEDDVIFAIGYRAIYTVNIQDKTECIDTFVKKSISFINDINSIRTILNNMSPFLSVERINLKTFYSAAVYFPLLTEDFNESHLYNILEKHFKKQLHRP